MADNERPRVNAIGCGSPFCGGGCRDVKSGATLQDPLAVWRAVYAQVEDPERAKEIARERWEELSGQVATTALEAATALSTQVGVDQAPTYKGL